MTDLSVNGYTIEILPASEVKQQLEEEVVGFWVGQQVFPEDVARERLGRVVCVLRDGNGKVCGVNSFDLERVGFLDNLPMFRYRMLLDASVIDPAVVKQMVLSFWEYMNSQCDGSKEGQPKGMIAEIHHKEFVTANKELFWNDSRIAYAGGHPGFHRLLGYFPESLVEQTIDVKESM